MSTPTTKVRRRVAVVIYEDASRDLARAYRGLLTAKEFRDAGDDVVVVYDGSGVDTLAAAADPGHQLHRLVEGLRDITLGACGFCVKAHGVLATVQGAGWTLLDQYKGHASIRQLVGDERTILSF
jgi:intracellular sulfur oxidation DsrE/DsrF family protein